jgi:hypothetical protein
MEYWNVGILVKLNEIYFYMDGTDQKIKSDHPPLLMSNIPFFSPIRRLSEPEAISPVFHGSSDGNHHPFSKMILLSEEPLGFGQVLKPLLT